MNIELYNKINEVIATHIRPALQVDGGDIIVIGLNGNELSVRLCGACSCCPHASMTLKHGVENQLRALVSKDITVKAI